MQGFRYINSSHKKHHAPSAAIRREPTGCRERGQLQSSAVSRRLRVMFNQLGECGMNMAERIAEVLSAIEYEVTHEMRQSVILAMLESLKVPA